MGSATIEIQGENAFVRVDSCEYKVCPEGEVKLIIPVGVQGDSGLATLAQFVVLQNLYNATLLPFTSNAVAFAILGAGKEYIAGPGNFEIAQGAKMITYTP